MPTYQRNRIQELSRNSTMRRYVRHSKLFRICWHIFLQNPNIQTSYLCTGTQQLSEMFCQCKGGPHSSNSSPSLRPENPRTREPETPKRKHRSPCSAHPSPSHWHLLRPNLGLAKEGEWDPSWGTLRFGVDEVGTWQVGGLVGWCGVVIGS